MPLLIHAVAGPLRRHGEPVELAGEADGEVGDVDHLLDLALALGEDLAHLQRDERPQRLLLLTQGVPDEAHILASFGRRQHPPLDEGLLSRGDDLFVVVLGGLFDRADRVGAGGVLNLYRVAGGVEPAAGETAAAGVVQIEGGEDLIPCHGVSSQRAAVTSISTRKPTGTAATWTVDRAGGEPVKNLPYASLTTAKSSMSTRKIEVLTMSS